MILFRYLQRIFATTSTTVSRKRQTRRRPQNVAACDITTMSDHAIAVSSVPPWRRLMGAWRRSKAQHGAAASGDALASALGIIQAERERWAGTQRTICTEAELEERFFIRNEIGRGSYGTVYRAIRVADAEELAVKVIDHSGLEDVRAQTIRECALWQEICSPYHPSILPLIEVVEVVGTSTLHLFTEVMSWGTLAEAIHDEDVDTSEASAKLMVIQIASAVAHLHTVHAVAHRDIKPENVLCAESDPTLPGCLKLCDFGCCRRFTNVREAEFEDVLGTINYVAPELAAGFLAASASEPRHCGPAADCWALGAVCYEILHGAPPFADAKKYPSDEEKLMAIASPLPDGGPVSYPEASFGHISEAGRAFLRRLLTRAHAERATIEEALAMAWLQPVNDKAARDAMAAAAPSRPEAATTARPTGRLRTAVRRLMLANRWIGGSSTAPVPDGQLSARSARRPCAGATSTPSS